MGGGGGGGTQGAFNGSGGAGAHATALSASVSGTASSGKQRGWHDSLVGDELFIRKTVHSSKQYRLFDATHEVIDCCEPCAVPFFTRKKVRTMCCGESHITVQCGDTVYAWGKNSYGQLGKRRDQGSMVCPTFLTSRLCLCGFRNGHSEGPAPAHEDPFPRTGRV